MHTATQQTICRTDQSIIMKWMNAGIFILSVVQPIYNCILITYADKFWVLFRIFVQTEGEKMQTRYALKYYSIFVMYALVQSNGIESYSNSVAASIRVEYLTKQTKENHTKQKNVRPEIHTHTYPH